MKKITRWILAVVVLIFPLINTVPGISEDGNRIQMAILLDTSSSMNGLIEQAKSQLWKTVNELAKVKKNGKSPVLEVALYEYGKSTLPSGEGYIRMIVPLTTDLDRVSEELFRLDTNGGDEYCGMVIKSAVEGLKWSTAGSGLRVIFIAGNEPFNQGNVDYNISIKQAAKKGIIVNTIFCGSEQEGIEGKWKHGAVLSDGSYMIIDHNKRVVHVKAPQDDEINRLGVELNKTYIGYGKKGTAMKERQMKQDSNASSLNKGAMVERSLAKASAHYKNSEWDLVDAVKDDSVDVASISEDELPDEMKRMSKKERTEYINRIIKKRAGIQARINKLNKERSEYVEKERKKRGVENTLDEAVNRTIKKQALKKDFEF